MCCSKPWNIVLQKCFSNAWKLHFQMHWKYLYMQPEAFWTLFHTCDRNFNYVTMNSMCWSINQKSDIICCVYFRITVNQPYQESTVASKTLAEFRGNESNPQAGCVCVCVCVCEREREIESNILFSLLLYMKSMKGAGVVTHVLCIPEVSGAFSSSTNICALL